MTALALSCGFQPITLLDAQATASALLASLTNAARELRAGDLFLLTFAGHGAQIPDASEDEVDKLDETWVLYDRMLVDDELYAALGNFVAGTRILLLSDSCHSGTISRRTEFLQSPPSAHVARAGFRTPDEPNFGARVWAAHGDVYESLALSGRHPIEISWRLR